MVKVAPWPEVLMAWLRRATFTPFVAYRIALGGVLLWMIYSGALGPLQGS